MRVYLEDAEELAESQIKGLFRTLKRSGAATIDAVQRRHVPAVELRYDLLVAVVPGWMTTAFEKRGRTRAPHDDNVAATRAILDKWVKDTALKVGSVAEVVRCDVVPDRPVRGRPPEFHLCLVVRVPNAALDGFTRTTRAAQQGAGRPGLAGHVQSAVSGPA